MAAGAGVGKLGNGGGRGGREVGKGEGRERGEEQREGKGGGSSKKGEEAFGRPCLCDTVFKPGGEVGTWGDPVGGGGEGAEMGS